MRSETEIEDFCCYQILMTPKEKKKNRRDQSKALNEDTNKSKAMRYRFPHTMSW